MKSDHKSQYAFVKYLRWLGRLVGMLASAFFLVFFVGEGISQGVNLHAFDGSLMLFAFFLLLAVCGCAVALFREGAGAMMQFISGISMGIFHLINGGIKDMNMALVFGLPFAFSGIVLLICRSADKRSK